MTWATARMCCWRIWGLFGCGFIGVNANQCQELDIRTCDIYSCSGIGINLSDVKDCKVTGCTIRDLGHSYAEASSAISAYGGEILSWKTPKFTGINAYDLLSIFRMPASAAAPSRITP